MFISVITHVLSPLSYTFTVARSTRIFASAPKFIYTFVVNYGKILKYGGGHENQPERRVAMKATISIIVAVLGTYFCEADFLTLFTFTSLGIELYSALNDLFTNDKAALQ